MEVLDLLPKGYVFDGELVVLDDAGRPLFNELLFGRRRPTYVAFDLLIADGIDLRPLPLEQRKARLARISEHPLRTVRPTRPPLRKAALTRAWSGCRLWGDHARADRGLPAP
jgi:bifunctional non-homologous end joining protein LigD